MGYNQIMSWWLLIVARSLECQNVLPSKRELDTRKPGSQQNILDQHWMLSILTVSPIFLNYISRKGGEGHFLEEMITILAAPKSNAIRSLWIWGTEESFPEFKTIVPIFLYDDIPYKMAYIGQNLFPKPVFSWTWQPIMSICTCFYAVLPTQGRSIWEYVT